ncbi:MAG: LysR family transcriptional regulator [Candidatus Eisenbacteria sp.]|nr:LysR family transcriptional regulator [Candidatus Eisenbacteria bacterium]
MDLQKLRGFYWSAYYQSFSAAGRKLGVGQSAISHQFKSLEEELGVKLYERAGRGIRLTAEGEILLGYASSILQKLDDLENHFRDLSGHPAGTIRLASYRSIMKYKLPEILREFKDRSPGTRLKIEHRNRDREVLSMVAAGEIDFGITSSWNEFRDTRFFEVFSFDMYLCTALSHRFARRKRITLEEIASESLVLYERDNSIRKRIEGVFAKHGLSVDVTIETGGAEVIKEYVSAGLGISIISGLAFEQDEGANLHRIPVTEYFGKLGYGVAIRHGKYLSPVLREFLRVLGLGETLEKQSWQV